MESASARGPAVNSLPSWNDGKVKESIVRFVERVTDEAVVKGWTVVDMKRDWKAIYPPEKVK